MIKDHDEESFVSKKAKRSFEKSERAGKKTSEKDEVTEKKSWHGGSYKK